MNHVTVRNLLALDHNLALDGQDVNAAPTVINGSTSGAMTCSMPIQGSALKRVMIRLAGFQSTAKTWVFPTPFCAPPVASFGGNENVAVTPTQVTVTSSTAPTDDFICLDGF